MSVNSLNTFLNVKDSHLRVVSGNVYATAMNIGGINVDVAHGLQSVTDQGNVTSNTLQFSNATTGFVTTANITVGRDLTVTGNALVSSNLTVTGNVMVSDDLTVTENLLVSNNLTVTKNVTVTGNTFYTNPMSISVDSNVVAEYTGPHDRPLRKYPEVALTSASQDGYVVTASSQYNVDYAVYNAFNDVIQEGEAGAAGVLWTSANSTYPASGGFYVGTTNGIGTTYGEFVKLELPYKIKPKEVRIFPRKFHSGVGNAQSPAQFKIFGSNDNFSSEIVEIYHQNTDWVNNGTWGVFDISHTTHFKHFGIVFTKTNGSIIVGVQEIEYYGHEEGSGSLDTTLKSVYNVPATTGTQLEVYYDAKDLANGAVTSVTDLSPNTNGGTGTDVTVADGAFVFNGTSSLMEKTSLSIPGGDNPFTFSFWLKNDDFDSNQYILRLGDNTTTYQTIAIYKNHSNQIIFASWTLDFPIDYTFTSGQWNHISLVYPGGGWKQSNLIVYIDGRPYTFGGNVSSGGLGGTVLSLATSLTLRLGGFAAGNTHLDGSIANFRLYSKALNAGQVKELYDYQKDYFLGSKSQVTLYKGHLGVGVAEPSGQLELAGDARLQEYPPRGVTGYETLVEGHGVFCASASSEFNSTMPPHKMFNKIVLLNADDRWRSSSSVYTATAGGSPALTTSGSARLASNTPHGQWIVLKLPYKICLKQYNWVGLTTQDAKEGQVWGSNDGQSWSQVNSFTNGGDAWVAAGSNDSSYIVYENTRTITGNTTYYSYYAFIITKIVGNDNAAGIRELKYFGTPGPTTLDKGSLTLGRSLDVPRISRYDVDTETPRPEKLVVDFDTTVNSSPTDISGKGNHGKMTSGFSYSAADKAFEGDSSTANRRIEVTGVTTAIGAGNFLMSVSMWFKLKTTGATRVLWGMVGENDGTDGTPSSYSAPHAVVNASGNITWAMWGNDLTNQTAVVVNRWYHCVWTYSGGTTGRKMFLDGVEQTFNIAQTNALNMVNATSRLTIGVYPHDLATYPLDGYVSNFKLYNAALEGSEVKKLYNLGRTGRSMVISDTAVGIGKVPEAQLDVRGTIKGVNMTTSIAAWSVARTTNINDVAGPTTIQWTDVQYNIGGCYSSPNFTAPVSGYYYHSMHMITKNDSVATYVGYYINDIDVDTQADFGAYDDASGSNSYGHRNIAGSWIIYLNAGDRLKLVLKDGSMNSNLNRWSGFFLST